MTLTPNDFYGRSCEVSGHVLGNYEDTKRCIFCGEFESQQGDKMIENDEVDRLMDVMRDGIMSEIYNEDELV